MWTMSANYSTRIIFIAFLIGSVVITAAENGDSKVVYLEAGNVLTFQPPPRGIGFFENNLQVYCYAGTTPTVSRLFESVELLLDIADDDYTQYEGPTAEKVREHYNEKRSLFTLSLFDQHRPRLQLYPYEQQCIGIETSQSYRLRINLTRVDLWRVVQLSIALLLFCYANILSHNSFFYYFTGILLGICSSFVLLIWLTSKMVPKRPIMYGVLLGGWTICIYVLQTLWENLQFIVVTYRTYVIWYITITGFVSFIFCYRLGPPKNKRSQDIVKWLLQVFSLLLMYMSSHYKEAMATLIILITIAHYFPKSLFNRLQVAYRRKFPMKRRLLTVEEFEQQGVTETTKALNELRNYASSPECKQWKVISQLRDPLRFASFVEGASHVSNDEMIRLEEDSESQSETSEEELSDRNGDDNDGDNQRDRRQNSMGNYGNRNRLETSVGYSRVTPPSRGISSISSNRREMISLRDEPTSSIRRFTSGNFNRRPIEQHSVIADNEVPIDENQNRREPISLLDEPTTSIRRTTPGRLNRTPIEQFMTRENGIPTATEHESSDSDESESTNRNRLTLRSRSTYIPNWTSSVSTSSFEGISSPREATNNNSSSRRITPNRLSNKLITSRPSIEQHKSPLQSSETTRRMNRSTRLVNAAQQINPQILQSHHLRATVYSEDSD